MYSCPHCDATLAEKYSVCPYCAKVTNFTDTNDAGETLQSTKATLVERGKRYGPFTEHAKIAQGFKTIMYSTMSWNDCSADKKQALEMFADKIARILNGDPTYDDSWRDIAGYAQLIVDELNKDKQ